MQHGKNNSMKNIGISFSGGHDSSACFVKDKELLFAISEERLTRKNHDSSFPLKAIHSGFIQSQWAPEDVDYVVLGWQSPIKYFIHDLSILTNTSLMDTLRSISSHIKNIYSKGGLKSYEREFGKTRLLYCDHHLAHAISSYAYSPFNEATILVIDGRGAFESSSIWYAKDGFIKPVEFIKWPNSLGFLYAKFTKYLGFQPLSDEWKVMGLAAYGKEGINLSDFINHEKKIYKVNWKEIYGKGLQDVSGIEKILGTQRKDENEDISDRFKDIAFAIQQETEKAMLNLTEYAIKKTGCKNLCLSGGVALNCKANGMIVNSGLINDIFIQPAASDEGVSLGAALYPYLLSEKRLPKVEMKHSYLGLQYSSEQVEGILKLYKLTYIKMNNRAYDIAKELAMGKIVGHFNGRMEFGPRALGNRSILADPRIAEMKDKVNNSVKYREWWRPFAPSILEEHYSEFFKTGILSPFMILSFPVIESKKEVIPAAVHVDGTARPQSVNKNTNQEYWEIINEFYKLTNVPVLLNTSFNLKGEPIVCSPFDAIRTFYTSGLDVLAIDKFLIRK